MLSSLAGFPRLFKMEKGCRDICVRVLGSSGFPSWYFIDSNTPKDEILSPLPLDPFPHFFDFAVASSGSKLYVTGGDDMVSVSNARMKSNDVYCLDTHHPEKGWEPLPPMICGRSRHGSGFFGNKLYVWSGGDREHMAEMYDPKCERWEIVDESTLHAVIGATQTLPKTLITRPLFIPQTVSKTVGGVLCALDRYHPNYLLAYDSYGEKSVISSCDLSEYLPSINIYSDELPPLPYMVSLGDDILGVVWLEDEAPPVNPAMYEHESELCSLFCSKFTIKHHKGGSKCSVEPIYHSRHYIKRSNLHNCVAVEPRGDVRTGNNNYLV